MYEYAVSVDCEEFCIGAKSLSTQAFVTMNVEGLEKLIFTKIHFAMQIGLEKRNESEERKANKVYDIAQKICPLRQSWGEDVPISFELCFI